MEEGGTLKIQWGKEQREKAKAEGKGLFAVGADSKHGKWVIGGMMDHMLCHKAAVFVHHLYQTKDPLMAFSKTWPDVSLLPLNDANEVEEL